MSGSAGTLVGPCDPPIANEIVCENPRPGSPPSEWEVSKAGDPGIQGFATEISVNRGETIAFKILTTAVSYRIDVYRLGKYSGMGAPRGAQLTGGAGSPLRAAADGSVAAALSSAPAASQVERHSPAAGSPFLGPADAPLTLVVFFDYQCPVCLRAAGELERLVADLGGTARVSLHHHPLAMHRMAMDAALAASAAQRQGKFWEYHQRLLVARGSFSPADWERFAAELGLDLEQFRRDLADPRLRQPIDADAQAAEALDARGTPAFVLNGQVEVGWASYERLRSLVTAEWERFRPAVEERRLPLTEVTRLRVRQVDPGRAEIILDLLQR